jgi:hypothetical protein
MTLFLYHVYTGLEPPLTGVAVKLPIPPQNGMVVEATETLTGLGFVKVMVMLLLVADGVVRQGKLGVITTLTTFPEASVELE